MKYSNITWLAISSLPFALVGVLFGLPGYWVLITFGIAVLGVILNTYLAKPVKNRTNWIYQKPCYGQEKGEDCACKSGKKCGNCKK